MIKKWLIITGRALLYTVSNFLLPLAVTILRRFRLVDFVFLVYPGTDQDFQKYYFSKKLNRCFPSLTLAGIVRKGSAGKRGIVMGTHYTIDEMANGRFNEVLKQVTGFSNSIGARTIALAGRMPSLLIKNGIRAEPPLVLGNMGATFVVTESVEQIIKDRRMALDRVKVGVMGIGFVGRRVINSLKSLGICDIRGVDINLKDSYRNNGLRLGNDASLLEKCDLIIVLTTRGEDIEKAIPHFKKGAILLDDTHPSIPQKYLAVLERNGNRVFKVVTGLDGIKFFPRLPNFDPEWIPGCVIEAIVLSGGADCQNQEEFNRLARQCGFRALLVAPRGES